MKRQWLILSATAVIAFGACMPVLANTPEPQQRNALAFQRKVAFLADRLVVGNSTLYELDKPSGRVVAKLALGSPICSDPLSVAGDIYVVTADGVVRAVKDAKEIWKTKLPDAGSFEAENDCDVMAFADYLCVSGPDATMCLRRATGQILWKLDTQGQVQVSGGVLYVADKSNAICAIDLSTGKTLWKEPGEVSEAGPILIKDKALYVAHGRDGGFSKLDFTTGKVLWKKVDSNCEIIWGPIVSLPGDQIAARDRNGGLDVFDCHTGEYFKYGPADSPPIATDPNANLNSQINFFLCENDMFYAGGVGNGAFMSAFEPQTKKQKWLTAIHETNIRVAMPALAGPPVLHKNQLLCLLDTGVVYALDSTTGKLCWKTETGRYVQGVNITNFAPVIFVDRDTICVCDTGGVSAIDAVTGKRQWRIDIEEPVMRSAVQDGDRLYLETFGGTAYALDLGKGKVAWSFTADGAPKKAEAVVRSEDAGTPEFPSSAWIAAKKTRNWSRRKLMEQFCQQYRFQLDGMKMHRAEVLKLLGQPEMSYEYPQRPSTTSGKGSSMVDIPATITDRYQLSEKTGTFEIRYDEKGVVSDFSSSEEACIFNDYLGPSSAQPQATVEKARTVIAFGSITRIEQLLGPPGRAEVNEAPAFPTPLRYSSYFWNLSRDGRKVLWVRTTGHFSEDLAKRRIEVVCILSISPDCPVKH